MVPLVLRFVSSARAAGLRVATSEVLDCLRQLEWVDPLEEIQFKTVLQANFAKSRREQAHFERLYRLFFHELRQDPAVGRSGSLAEPLASVIDQLAEAEPRSADRQALFDFLRGDPAALLEAVRAIESGADGRGGGLGFGLGAVTRRLELLLAANALEDALAQRIAARRAELGWEERRDLSGHVRDRLETARRLLGQTPGQTAAPPSAVKTHRRYLDELGNIHFASLTPREVEAMREAVEQFVRRLKDKIGRRYAARARGVLDVKKTLRRAAAYQGVPLEVFYRRHPPRKAKIVTLCDVSGSVWSAARFMLNMLYSLQECFSQVRSFIFVAGLAEVTDVFKRHDVNRAIDKILKEAAIDYNAATDYGRTFREFKRDYLDILDKKTTLIVIGDGRSNYTSPEDRILAQMRERSRRLIWLNPETEQFWYTGDSEMRALGAVCDVVRPCQNLNQLLDFITSLVL
jgi:uncharacterized protein with von Willebrand factor type A (vWA) domain